MKILIIANYNGSAGGISSQVKLLNYNLNKDGYQSYIFSTKANIIVRILLFFRLIIIGRDKEVFHIHACSHWGFLPAIYGIAIGKLLQKKIILTYHGGGADEFFHKHKKFVRWWLSKTDQNIVLSGFLGNVFEKYNIPYTILPNILEQDHITKFRKNSISPKFISVRTLQPLYNIMCIVKAFEVVQKKINNASLTILADGPCRKDLENYVNEHKLQNVKFTGFIPNKNVVEEMEKANILLSAPFIDNQPVSILEGFKAGLLVISSNVGGVPYMIKDQENGLLFENDNYKDLANKMLWAIANQSESISMIKKGQESLRSYSWDNIKNKLFDIYNVNI